MGLRTEQDPACLVEELISRRSRWLADQCLHEGRDFVGTPVPILLAGSQQQSQERFALRAQIVLGEHECVAEGKRIDQW